MDFAKLIPLNDIAAKEFGSCADLCGFLNQVIVKIRSAADERTQQAYLAVYMAFRDHYPSYLSGADKQTLKELDQMIEKSNPKIIKLRRVALAEISKVA